MIIPQEIVTGLAVFAGTILGGVIVAEYSLHRGKNMISNAIKDTVKSFNFMKLINDFVGGEKPRNEGPEDYK